jgi:multidrug efflux pump
MASAVTTPLERQFGQVPSLAQMTSVSSFSTSQITLQFTLERNIDAAEQDVQAAINGASSFLPNTLPAPPTYSKSNPAETPVLTLAVSSKTLPLSKVDDFADSVLAQKIAQVAGVGLVTLNGGQKPAVRVQVDPQALAGTGLTLEDVRAVLAAANVNQPKGTIDGERLDYTIATNDQLAGAADFRPLLLAYKDGAPLRLADVATVEDGVENAELAGWAGSDRAVILNVLRQPGANIIQVADGVKTLLPRLSAAMPSGIDVSILSDRTETVRASVRDVELTLLLTVFLVVVVIFVFLGSLRATLIPGVGVPLTIIATFGVMHLVGFSLNNLSLMALTISTGFIVDDAIVMIENISRYIEDGQHPFHAALAGAKQIGFTIVSLTASLCAVLIPLLFMGGLIGRLFREFAVTLALAIVLSAFLTLTLTAMMCAWVLAPHRAKAPGRAERAFQAVTAGYERTLGWVLHHRGLMLGLVLGTVGLTGVLGLAIRKGFFPVQDTGLILGVTEAAPDVSFARMRDRQEALARVVLADPDVATVASFIGADGTNATVNSGRMSIALRPRSERSADASAIIARLAPRLADVAGVAIYLQPVQDLQIDSRLARTPYQYTLEDADPNELATWAPRVLARLQARPELAQVASDQEEGGLAVELTVDRDTAGRLGVTSQAIDDTLYDAFGQRPVSTIFTQLNLYRVILEVRPEDQKRAEALDHIYVRAASGTAVPLSAFARYTTRPVALAIAHQGQFPSVTLSFDTAPGFALGQAVEAIRAVEAELGAPAGLHATFQGAAQAFRDSLASEPILLLAAILTVYIVLGMLYESYIHPLTILSSLPSAGVGALLALFVTGREFDVIALIGMVLLVGIVMKNAIMMIDFALAAERERGLDPEQSIFEACRLRFRPIVMTTVAALLGALPLAVGSGTGSELRRPLGITIVGGLLVSQILTLYSTPVIYLAMDRLAHGLGRRRAPATESA